MVAKSHSCLALYHSYFATLQNKDAEEASGS